MAQINGVAEEPLDDEGVTKRLSFGEMSQQLNTMQQIDSNDVIKALRNPSTDNFERCDQLMAQRKRDEKNR